MADLKTYNGIAEANLKTFNGLAKANWKTFNGLNIPVASSGVEFDAVGVNSWIDGGVSITGNHTCSGDDRLLIVDIIQNAGTLGAITYNGTALSLYDSFTTGSYTISRYYLINPDSGSHNVVVAFAGVDGIWVESVSFKNVHQTVPFGTASGDTDTSLLATIDVVSTVTGGLVLDATLSNSLITVVAGQTQRWVNNDGPGQAKGSSKPGDGGTVTMSYDLSGSNFWIMFASEIKPV